MAQLLRDEGESVALLAMLDTYNYSRALRVGFTSFLAQKTRFHLANLSELGPRHFVNYLRAKTRQAFSGELANLRSAAPGGSVESPGRATSGVELSIQAINDRAAEEYVPKPYSGDVTIIKPRVNYKFYPDPKMGYGDLIRGRIDIVEVGTNPHAMLLEPHVEILAREIKRRIDDSGREGSNEPGRQDTRQRSGKAEAAIGSTNKRSETGALSAAATVRGISSR
jgi:thioesterase domain-containing protein